MAMTRSPSWQDALRLLKQDGPIYIAGNCGEPTAALDAFAADPEALRGRTLTGVWIPGVNRRDPTAEIPGIRAETIFTSADLSDGIAAGRVSIMPMHYSAMGRRFAAGLSCGGAPLAGGILQVAPPRDGRVSLGVSVDFTPAIAAAGVPLIAQVNPAMPEPADGVTLPVDRFAALIEAESTLPAYDAGAPSSTLARIGQVLAEMIRPGDTLQLGIGKLQAAVLSALDGAHDLTFHAGMIAPGIMDRLEGGVFLGGVTTGVALGDIAFYDRAASDTRIAFRPVDITHGHASLSGLDRLTAINTVLEVDLFGQANGEMVGGRQITGHGGLVDFVRGAQASPGGRSVLALPATARGGTESRIRAALDRGTVATVGRGDADFVVTEYGVASLRDKSIEQRAEALTAIAAPEFRDTLWTEWEALRRQ